MDTLDYSGGNINEGSKVVIAAAGPERRKLLLELPGDMQLPEGFSDARLCLPGVIAIEGPAYQPDSTGYDNAIERFCKQLSQQHPVNWFPLVVIVDDARFTAHSFNNFVWVTFTRSNPAADIYGVDAFINQKHWGCEGSLVIDARIKTHHAPPLIEDPDITDRVNQLAIKGGPLHGII